MKGSERSVDNFRHATYTTKCFKILESLPQVPACYQESQYHLERSLRYPQKKASFDHSQYHYHPKTPHYESPNVALSTLV
jgi:hypothetical protein